MAWVRLYLINFVQVDDVKVTTNPSLQWEIKANERVGYILGWLLFGNVVDNAFDPRIFIVACSLIMSFYFFGVGIYLEMARDTSMSVEH